MWAGFLREIVFLCAKRLDISEENLYNKVTLGKQSKIWRIDI